MCITNNLTKHQSFVYTQLNDPTVLFQTIQFSINHLFAYTLSVKQFSGATTSGHCGLEGDGNKGVLRIFQSSSITRDLPSDFLV